MTYRCVLYSPDRAIAYDGRTPDELGVGGGITARVSLLAALAAIGHTITAYVNCRDRIQHQGVNYVPLDDVSAIDADVLIAISTGGDLSFTPLRQIAIHAPRRILWVQGVPQPADLDAIGADTVCTASEFLRDVVVDRWRIDRRRVFVSYNGVQQTRFEAAAAASIRRDPFALSYIGPPEKGLASALAVLRRLRARDERYHLDVFGGSRLWGRSEDDVPREPGVVSMGLLGQEALAPKLFAGEFCLAPQAMEEGFGIAVQEARRAGQIVLASRVGAFPELIEDERDGFLINDAHDTAASHDRMAATVLALSADPARRERIREAAMAAASCLSWTRAAEEWTAEIEASAVGRTELRSAQQPRKADRSSVRPTTLTTVLLAGYYGHGNLGDEAILRAILDGLRRASPSIDAIVVSGDPATTASAYGVEAVHERDIEGLARAASRSEAVVLGGGGLFHDYAGVDEETMLTPRQWGLAYCAALAAIASNAGKPFVVHAAGVGPLTTAAGRRLTRMIFERASLASVRDDESRDLLRSLDVNVARLRVIADPAYALDPIAPGQAQPALVRAGVVSDGGPLITVALRAWAKDVDPAEWQTEIAGAIDRAIDETVAAVLFVPFQSSAEDDGTDDREVIASVRSRMRRGEQTVVAPADLSLDDVRSVISASSVVLAMRAHAAALAALADVPVLALAYDPKVRAMMTQLGGEKNTFDLAAVKEERLAELLIERAGGARAQSGSAAQRLRASAQSGLEDLANAIGSKALGNVPASGEWSALVASCVRRGGLQSVRRGGLQPAQALAAPRSFAKRMALAAVRLAARSVTGRLMDRASYAFDLYKQRRTAIFGSDFSGVRAPGERGLVSIVLPVHNGEAWLAEAIDSVLAQTYSSFELIIVDDGSTDGTREIAKGYRDARIRIVHQEHHRLPHALSTGFAHARGEFRTWTSADNRLKPQCLEQLYGSLMRHPAWDMAFGNLDIIGERGEPLRGSSWYEGYQRPPGSEHIALPQSSSALNVVANNFVGAAFLYRSRVSQLLGDYSRFRFVMEDYEYWMRVNALMTLEHADAEASLYDYRFHDRSLTAKWSEFDMFRRRDRLMVFDDARRDASVQPMVWVIDGDATGVARALRSRAAASGQLVSHDNFDLLALGSIPVVHVRATTRPAMEGRAPLLTLPAGATSVLVAASETLPDRMDETWSACFSTTSEAELPCLAGGRRGWMGASSTQALFTAIDAKARVAHAARMEELAEAGDAPALKATVVICTRGPIERVRATLDGIARQDFTRPYEVIVVLNRSRDRSPASGLRSDRALPPDVRVLTCPVPGLSAARNAAIAEARGEIVCFIDDDAVPETTWLARIVAAFDAHPEAGVVGGRIALHTPAQRPFALRPGWRKYWSEFLPGETRYYESAEWGTSPWGANWAARRDVLRAIGGFRSRYGRVGNNFWGGEEMVAAALVRKLGRTVGVEPRASVTHHVDPSRFTLRHVFRSMLAGHLVRHRAQRDLYLPGEGSIEVFLRRLWREHADPAMAGDPARAIDIAFRKIVQARLLLAELADLTRRAR